MMHNANLSSDSDSEDESTLPEQKDSAPVDNIASQSSAELKNLIEIEYKRAMAFFREMKRLVEKKQSNAEMSELLSGEGQLTVEYEAIKRNDFLLNEDYLGSFRQFNTRMEADIERIKENIWVPSSERAMKIVAEIEAAFNRATAACNNYYDLRDKYPYYAQSRRAGILQDLGKLGQLNNEQAITYSSGEQIIINLDNIALKLELKTGKLQQYQSQTANTALSDPTLEVKEEKVSAIDSMSIEQLQKALDGLEKVTPFHDAEGEDPDFRLQMCRMDAIRARISEMKTQQAEQEELDAFNREIKDMEDKAQAMAEKQLTEDHPFIKSIQERYSSAKRVIDNLDDSIKIKKLETLNRLAETAKEFVEATITLPGLHLQADVIFCGELDNFINELKTLPVALVMHVAAEEVDDKTSLPVIKTDAENEFENLRIDVPCTPVVSTYDGSFFGNSSTENKAPTFPNSRLSPVPESPPAMTDPVQDNAAADKVAVKPGLS